ncbi:hypothetical protein FRC00_007017 [Tulasnella sp. 408]|nr:hypothetical protein FRC00_007017 [Tulasnella sp. 408]
MDKISTLQQYLWKKMETFNRMGVGHPRVHLPNHVHKLPTKQVGGTHFQWYMASRVDIQREHEQAEKEWLRIPGKDNKVMVEEEEEEEEDGAPGGSGQQALQSPVTSSRVDSWSAEKRAPGMGGKVTGV